MKSKNGIKNMVLSAMFLAVALVLPLLTGQIPEMGNMLCPMHLPILLCGFICGPWYAMGIGLIAPILRFFIFGMPPIVPKGIPMSLELATYGLVVGLLYKLLPKKKKNVYVSLIVAMLAGRVVWGIAKTVLMGLGKIEFGWKFFLTDGFVEAVPGIILQIILIPVLVFAINKNKND